MTLRKETFIDILLKFPEDIKDEYKYSKLPKFIKKFLIKRDLKKIYKSIDRLKEEGVILEKPVIDQYLSIIENEFQPKPKYGVVSSLDSTYNYEFHYKVIIGRMYVDDVKFKLKSDSMENTFELEIYSKDPEPGYEKPLNKSYTFIDSKLFSKSPEYSEYVRMINHALLMDICDYFKEYLKSNLGV